jgi:hypothetical protein
VSTAVSGIPATASYPVCPHNCSLKYIHGVLDRREHEKNLLMYWMQNNEIQGRTGAECKFNKYSASAYPAQHQKFIALSACELTIRTDTILLVMLSHDK